VRHLLNNGHPIKSRIDAIYHEGNSQYLKPDYRVFNKLLYQFDLMPEECVYVGDAVTDAVAANGAGMHFFAVLESGLRAKEDFKEVKVDIFVNKFSDIIRYIK
jgi:phosphoglycolate phosphatase-like HAD superfamily hydrolase